MKMNHPARLLCGWMMLITFRVCMRLAAGHWAFEPGQPVAVPNVQNSTWARTPIDRFVLHALEQHGLQPSPAANFEQLLRRTALGLTGLLPTPEEMDGFIREGTAEAYARWIERLLASPHYGERWGRHWLDLGRYAESDGFEHDSLRPHSWRYRDYVIRSLNQDKPFDQFIREQIAGDEIWPDEPEALIATGFNLLGPDMVDSADQAQRRLNTLNDMSDTTATVFLGQTLGCARCHDHKSEPFSQVDYYRWQAFFAAAEFHREALVPTEAERLVHRAAQADYEVRSRPQQLRIQSLEASVRLHLWGSKLATLSGDARTAHRTPKERRTPEQEATVQETALQVSISDAEVLAALSVEGRAERKRMEEELRRIPKPLPLPQAMVLRTTNGPPPLTRVLYRGDYNSPQQEVHAGVPNLFKQVHAASGFGAASARGRRTALADWIASPNNSLTARVLVNRIWQHHFGRGIVRTPSDFGTQGQPPTHPDLLDWLSQEFVAGGWSLKHLHRIILLSTVYQQSTTVSATTLELDPENHWFSRKHVQRLEGEVIRDNLLLISGCLNRTLGGPGVSPPIPEDILKSANRWTISPEEADHHRRSVYVVARRNLRFPFLEVFDAPDSNVSCPERGRSTTAPQALSLLNSPEVVAACTRTAARLQRESTTQRDFVSRTYRSILGRAPSPRERALAQEFLGASPPSELCRALLNLNEFVYDTLRERPLPRSLWIQADSRNGSSRVFDPFGLRAWLACTGLDAASGTGERAIQDASIGRRSRESVDPAAHTLSGTGPKRHLSFHVRWAESRGSVRSQTRAASARRSTDSRIVWSLQDTPECRPEPIDALAAPVSSPGPVGHRSIRFPAAPGRMCRRSLSAARLLWRQRHSSGIGLPHEHRLHTHGPREFGVLGGLRFGNSESEHAGLRRSAGSRWLGERRRPSLE
jgi:hypothetical protein